MKQPQSVQISKLLAAVKPKDRTDQYAILAALFALDAHTKPVPAKEASDLLRFHLGRKAPANVNQCLRAYTGYVTKHKGSPIRWSVTSKGVERLRSASGLPLSNASDAEQFKSDIGIICALEYPELAAVTKALGGYTAWAEIGDTRHTHAYRETSMTVNGGAKLRVVATTSTSMGLVAAAIATTQLIFQFRPRLVAMIGIAAGTRSGEKQFGDVLVADPSVDYNSGKVVLAGEIREFQPDPYPIGLNPKLRTLLHKYGSAHPLLTQIRGRWGDRAPAPPNRVHVGPLGAADQVIDDPTLVLEVQKKWRKLVGVEMETYGVYRAVLEAPEPKPRVVSFKAVCDFAAEKSDSWQDYAAFMAAEFAVEFLKREWVALWPTS